MLTTATRTIICLVAFSPSHSAAFVHLNRFDVSASAPSGGRLAPPLALRHRHLTLSAANDTGAAEFDSPKTPPPALNGRVVLPMRVLTPGLRDHHVAAVYAVLNSSYKKSSKTDGWEHCEHVGVTRDLGNALATHIAAHGKKSVAYVRALSFAYPQKGVMDETAGQWRSKVAEVGGNAAEEKWATDGDADQSEVLAKVMEASAYLYDDGDDDDYDDFDDDDDDDGGFPLFVDRTPSASSPSSSEDSSDAHKDGEVVSPFASDAHLDAKGKPALEFNLENVDTVLDEIRPYLISDGGNVSIEGVDEEKQNVYLKLEGACGSCASSTVTMKMGIERVLKENFSNLGDIIQVEDEAADGATELDLSPVQAELTRISPAMMAMGASVELISVDPELGVVKINFRGSNKVKQGLELAIRDVDYVRHVEFVSEQ